MVTPLLVELHDANGSASIIPGLLDRHQDHYFSRSTVANLIDTG
jgi:hypothetical protein